ncbi:MAG: DinB family protein, partial [Cyclobacteriaceae bacterium]
MSLDINQVPEYYRTYVRFIKDESVTDALQYSAKDFNYLLNTFSNEKAEHRYAEGKWSVKDLVQHVIDSERVFAYRALRFARNDATQLEGFEQDDYAAHADSDSRDIKELM